MVRSLALAAALLAATPALAQDFFDSTVLRTVNLQFHDANYWTLLQQNYQSQTNILADLTVDGVTYPSVGVRFRGNTSYTALPAGSQKTSFNIDVDFVDPNQTVMGQSSLNFNNGFHDPTLCREVVYNNFVAQFMPNPRANHIVLTLNGQNWGVYINVQQFNKTMLRDYFTDEDGLRIKCANNPNGPGLTYNGASASGYTGYEIKDDGGLADPWAPLISVCSILTSGSLANWQLIDQQFAIDPSTWSVMFENLLTDDDSYVNKGADFMLYRNPYDGRMNLLQTDANETFTQTTWSPTRNFTATNKPVLSRVLSVAELRQRYMAHMRYAMQDLDWDYFGAEFTRLRNLIDAAVQADPKKLYSYTLFQNNFTSQVTLPYSGPAGGTVPGLQQFVQGRQSFLAGIAELAATGPAISEVQASDSFPDPTEPVYVTARVAPTTATVSKVELYARYQPGTYQRIAMSDNGLVGDGAAGDGVYGAPMPSSGLAGEVVEFYVAATAANSYASMTFDPPLAENGPLLVQFSFGQSGLRITEYMYSGASGEFIELTNVTAEPIDLTGWSLDDDSSTPGVVSLSAAGVLEPGESVVVTEAAAAAFASAWGIPSAQVIGLNTAANLGRNDAITLFDAEGNLVDRLTYGDQSFPGTIRTQNVAGHTCRQRLGQDDIAAWQLATVGDAQDSWTSTGSDIGSPGMWASVSCFDCPADLDGDGVVGGSDLGQLLAQWGEAGSTDLDGDGVTGGSDLGALLAAWGACAK